MPVFIDYYCVQPKARPPSAWAAAHTEGQALPASAAPHPIQACRPTGVAPLHTNTSYQAKAGAWPPTGVVPLRRKHRACRPRTGCGSPCQRPHQALPRTPTATTHTRHCVSGRVWGQLDWGKELGPESAKRSIIPNGTAASPQIGKKLVLYWRWSVVAFGQFLKVQFLFLGTQIVRANEGMKRLLDFRMQSRF